MSERMSRPWQIFAAPGEDAEDLPIPPSPWHIERWAKLPQEHWWLILDVAARYHAGYARRLHELSSGSNANDQDEIIVARAELAVLIDFLDQIAAIVAVADPLVPYPTDDIPDAYYNTEHVRMIQAVIAVFQESIRLGSPYRVWIG